MEAKQVRDLVEAYSNIYAQREEDENFDFIIEEIVEELLNECLELGYDLDESLDLIEQSSIRYFEELEELEEAKVTYGSDTESPEQRRQRAKVKVGQKRSAARKSAIKGAVSRVRAKASGVKAAAGIAGSIAKDEVLRAGRRVQHQVGKAGEAVSTAVQRKKEDVKKGVKGLLKKGLSAVAGGAGRVAHVSRRVGAAAGRAAERLGEGADLFDYILEHLVAEGYADTNENALVIMTNMSEEWRESIVEEILDEKKGERPRGLPYGPVGKGFRELTIPQRAAMMKRGKEHTKAAMNSGDEYGKSHASSSAIDSALRSRRLGGRG